MLKSLKLSLAPNWNYWRYKNWKDEEKLNDGRIKIKEVVHIKIGNMRKIN